MGRKWTPEEKQAASEKAKAKIAAAQAAAEENKNTPPKQNETSEFEALELPTLSLEEQHDPLSGPQPGQVPNIQNELVTELLKRIQELEAAQWRQHVQSQPQAPTSGLQLGATGLVGTREKYIVNPSHYPDPTERLSSESRLQRFAFKDNYELKWQVTVSQYQTKDGINTREPKFTLDLNRIMYDDDTGLPTNRRYTVCRAIFHEDPQAALVVAQEQGINVEDYEEKAFLDEMRYLRIRDWLFEAFFPPRPQAKKNKHEMVIGNKVVEVFEISSESDEKMPFEMLDKNRKL